jgi:translation initiation factor 1 (eIF-1/SUI1)
MAADHVRARVNRFLGKLKNFSYVSRDGVGDVCKGAIAPVLIRTEQRQGRKVVTVLSGMETFLISAEALRQVLPRCNASILVREQARVAMRTQRLCRAVPCRGVA